MLRKVNLKQTWIGLLGSELWTVIVVNVWLAYLQKTSKMLNEIQIHTCSYRQPVLVITTLLQIHCACTIQILSMYMYM